MLSPSKVLAATLVALLAHSAAAREMVVGCNKANNSLSIHYFDSAEDYSRQSWEETFSPGQDGVDDDGETYKVDSGRPRRTTCKLKQGVFEIWLESHAQGRTIFDRCGAAYLAFATVRVNGRTVVAREMIADDCQDTNRLVSKILFAPESLTPLIQPVPREQ